MKEREENEKRMAEIEKHAKIGEVIKHNSSEVTERERTVKVHQNSQLKRVI